MHHRTGDCARWQDAGSSGEPPDAGPGASQGERREALLEAERRREIDGVLVWRPDRCGRSVVDLLATFKELEHLDSGVGFVSLTEALDLTTPTGRAMAGLKRRGLWQLALLGYAGLLLLSNRRSQSLIYAILPKAHDPRKTEPMVFIKF